MSMRKIILCSVASVSMGLVHAGVIEDHIQNTLKETSGVTAKNIQVGPVSGLYSFQLQEAPGTFYIDEKARFVILMRKTPFVLPGASDGVTKEEEFSQKISQELRSRVKDVAQSPVRQLVSFRVDGIGDVLYADKQATVIFPAMQIVDLKTKVNYTEERMLELGKQDWLSFPREGAIKQVYGKGERRVVVFSDANCGYCRQLEQTWRQVGNITVYTFIVPLIRGRKNNREIVCSKNPTQAWHDWMSNHILPTDMKPGVCTAEELNRNYQLAMSHGITGAPTIFFPSGLRISGAMPAAMLEQALSLE